MSARAKSLKRPSRKRATGIKRNDLNLRVPAGTKRQALTVAAAQGVSLTKFFEYLIKHADDISRSI